MNNESLIELVSVDTDIPYRRRPTMIPFPLQWPLIALTFWSELLRPRAGDRRAQVILFDRLHRQAMKKIGGKL